MSSIPTTQFSIPIKRTKAEKFDYILAKTDSNKGVCFYYDGSDWTTDGDYTVMSVSYSDKIVITIRYMKGNSAPVQATYVPENP